MTSKTIDRSRSNILFLILGGFFITNAVIAEFIGVKIFSLEKTFGYNPVSLSFFGEKGLSFNLSVGVIMWPVVFIMTDVINEYYGRKGVRFLSFLTVGLICYAFVMVSFAIGVEPADFWLDLNKDLKPDINYAYSRIFGQGLWIIIGSITAFLVGQIVDVLVFHRLRKLTGESMAWLRATGSTLVSQLVDSFVVLYIAFYIGGDWTMLNVLAVGLVQYIYKFSIAVLLTPAIYLAHWAIDHFLGTELAEVLKKEASE